MRGLAGLLIIGVLLLGERATATQILQKEADELPSSEFDVIVAAEKARIAAVKRVMGSVVAIFGDVRAGGGSGVIFDRSGLALTNHHVIAGAGVSGWAGIADGKLYRWNLVGTDPGGDLAIIRLVGDDFPAAPLGDSDKVRVGDWAMAMGNPFVLTEDQKPTVTLGIVSGVQRYQPGAGGNQLVYGNCIQVDSSINPGNSGGPLFNMQGEIIGINGRGSFQARGRVNVGLGYAISANQIKNFIPDLMATKLVEHGTLDVRFADRNGKVVCEAMYNEGVDIVEMGLELGDELLEFEGHQIQSNDQFTNLISTLPETWPASVVFKKEDGTVKNVNVRLFGLPYKIKKPAPPRQPKKGKKSKEPTPEQKHAIEKRKQMAKVMTTKAGTIRDKKMNAENSKIVTAHLNQSILGKPSALKNKTLIVNDVVLRANGQPAGKQTLHIAGDGRFRVQHFMEGQQAEYTFDGKDFWKKGDNDVPEKMTYLKARLTPVLVQVFSYSSLFNPNPYEIFGDLRIDGSDKSQASPAFRLKTVDAKSDWFFVWATLFNQKGELDIRLSKASADLNADGTSGAVCFGEWKEITGIVFPHRRDFVTGLGEVIQKSAVVKDIKVVDGIDSELFVVEVNVKGGVTR
jgi:serine protease Do